MAYGISQLIDDGVPAAIFPPRVTFYVGSDGAHHASSGCVGAGQATSVDPAALSFRALCPKCAQWPGPTQPELNVALYTAHALAYAADVLQLAAGEPSWTAVAGLQLALTGAANRLATGYERHDETVAAVHRNLSIALEEQRSRLRVDTDGWTDAALSLAATDRDAHLIPQEVLDRRIGLGLPPVRDLTNDRDGAWILPVIEEVVRETLLDGQGWDAATSRAQEEARTEVARRDRTRPTMLPDLDVVVADYVNCWREIAHLSKADRATNGWSVVVASPPYRSGLPSAKLTTFRTLLAPAAAAEVADGRWLTAIVPGPVADTLSTIVKCDPDDPVIAFATSCRETDTVQTLQAFAALYWNERMTLEDALEAARGITCPIGV